MPLRVFSKTYRVQGRRAITPMRSKHRFHIKKTRIKKDGRLCLQQQSSAQHLEEWSPDNIEEQCEDRGEQGSQTSSGEGEWKDTKEYEILDEGGDSQDKEQYLYSRSIQSNASLVNTNKTRQQEEEPSF